MMQWSSSRFTAGRRTTSQADPHNSFSRRTTSAAARACESSKSNSAIRRASSSSWAQDSLRRSSSSLECRRSIADFSACNRANVPAPSSSDFFVACCNALRCRSSTAASFCACSSSNRAIVASVSARTCWIWELNSSVRASMTSDSSRNEANSRIWTSVSPSSNRHCSRNFSISSVRETPGGMFNAMWCRLPAGVVSSNASAAATDARE
mmetsp:Transcript_33277/g.91737  ORF Transcript_33277/g.91737 Transcript_33277/m.91737 type:complete len:209 (-) Transcript_33277:558-1184(-)